MDDLKIPVNSADHIRGEADARYTLVQYGDFECPRCARAYLTVKRVQDHYGQHLRYVFRHFPLDKDHPYAEEAAEAAEFADSYGRFWEMHDLLFEHQKQIGGHLLIDLVKRLGLPLGSFRDAFDRRDFLSKVRENRAGGLHSGVKIPPAFFINERRYRGSCDYETLLRTIEMIHSGVGLSSKSPSAVHPPTKLAASR